MESLGNEGVTLSVRNSSKQTFDDLFPSVSRCSGGKTFKFVGFQCFPPFVRFLFPSMSISSIIVAATRPYVQEFQGMTEADLSGRGLGDEQVKAPTG